MLSSRINPLNTTRYWKMLETWFLHMLSSFGSEIFQRWSHVHSTCRSRDNFWVTSDPVEDTGDNIVFRIIDLLLVKLKWWQILRLTWLSCAISSEKMDLWVTCDRLVFKGYNLKWRNTRRMFYNSIVLDHMFYKILIWCFRKQFLSLVQHKDRPQVGQVTNILWSAPSFLQKLHRMRFSLNSGICWYFLLQWWHQCFSLACSAKRKRLLPIAIPSNQRFFNNNFEIKQGNWITKLRIHNVTVRNGNVDEIEKHLQIKSEFAFTI